MSTETEGTSTVDVVTGAFGYSGAAIARDLAAAGRRVRTLTNHPREGAGDIDVRPLDFTDPDGLTESLRDADTLYNTYWVRFARGRTDHGVAVNNSKVLFEAAARAGVRRVVHVSITNPSLDSRYPYFRGKAEVERILAATHPSHAIVRPAILFGGDGVLVNNIAWLLRRFPVFAIGGGGDYRIRAIHVDDLTRLCVRLGSESDNVTIDAVGPQSLPFREMVEVIKKAVGSHAAIVPVPDRVLPPLAWLLGTVLRDVLLTGDEFSAMVDGLADSDAPTTGEIAFTDWVERNATQLGRRYANELDRHFR